MIKLLSPYKFVILPDLRELDLSYNKIEDDAIYSVIESLLQIPKLAKVNFDGNPISSSNLLAINRVTIDFKFCISVIDKAIKDISSFFIILSSMKNVSERRSYQV